MEILCKPLGPVQANCYLLIQNHRAIVIDPGDTWMELESILKEKEAKLEAILLTHAHFDHIAGVDTLVEATQATLYLHPSEFEFLQDTRLNASKSFYQNVQCHTIPQPLYEGCQTIAGFDIEVKYTPGHSIGSTTFIIEDCLFTGDTIFQASVGRMDLPTGSLQQMNESIEYFKTLPETFKIYPGHGPSTNVKAEKQWNPYF